MRWVLSLLLVAAVAGCVDDSPTAAPADPAIADDPPSTDVPPAEGPAAVPSTFFLPETLPVHFNGSLGSFAYACEYQTTSVCQGHTVSESENDILVDAVGTLRTVQLTLTWSEFGILNPIGKVNENLFFEVMVMAREGGNSTSLGSVEGPTPLVLQLTGLDVPVTADDVVHAYAFNKALLVHNPPLVAHASIDQDIAINGFLVLDMMSTAPANATA